MKLKQLAATLALSGVFLTGCSAEDSKVELKTPAQKFSYAIGLRMGNDMREEGLDDVSPQAIALGMSDALAKREMRVSEEEQMEAYGFVLERARERMNAINDETAKVGRAFLEENKDKDGVQVTDSGLQYEVLSEGDGAKPGVRDVVQVHYHGTLVDGTVFDSSVERGQPTEFPVGAVIPGWVEGLQLMQVGAKYKFYIPSELAYGAQSPSPSIPANSALIFEVELLDILGGDNEEQQDQE